VLEHRRGANFVLKSLELMAFQQGREWQHLEGDVATE
jgi:hypothetical protein